MKTMLRKNPLKTALYLMLVLTVFLLPQFAMAQYKWVLNGIVSFRAGVSYFSSDALKDSSRAAHHNVIGWNGETPIDIDFCIRNYENTLLYNEKNQTIQYEVTFEVNTYRGIFTGSERTGETKDGTPSCIATLYKKDSHGNPVKDTSYKSGDKFSIIATAEQLAKQDNYMIELRPKIGHERVVNDKLPVGDRAEVVVTAERITEGASHEFAGALTCIFSYQVTDDSSYIKQLYLGCGDTNSSRFYLHLGTSDVPNMEGKAEDIILWWDTDAIGTTMVNNYVFSDALMTKDSKDYISQYATREVDGKTHTYSMLRLKSIGSDATRTVYFDLKADKGSQTLKQYLESKTLNMLARGVDPWKENKNRNENAVLTDEQIRNGAVIGYYIERINAQS